MLSLLKSRPPLEGTRYLGVCTQVSHRGDRQSCRWRSGNPFIIEKLAEHVKRRLWPLFEATEPRASAARATGRVARRPRFRYCLAPMESIRSSPATPLRWRRVLRNILSFLETGTAVSLGELALTSPEIEMLQMSGFGPLLSEALVGHPSFPSLFPAATAVGA